MRWLPEIRTDSWARLLLLVWLTLCLSVTARAQSPAPNDPDWVYESRPGETLQEIGQRFLAPPIEWTRLINHNRLTQAFQLPPGTRISIPVSWLRQSPQPAVVTRLQGEVSVRRAREQGYSALSTDDKLNVGDEVRTRNGQATVRFTDGSEIDISPGSRLIFNRLTRFGETGMSDTRFKVMEGKVENRVTPVQRPAGRYEVTTPGAVAAVRGTVFRIGVDDAQTQAEVLEGQVEVRNPAGSQRLNAGEGAIIGPQSLIQPQPLPEPPQVSIPERVQTLPFNIAWNEVPEVTRYRIRLLANETGEWVLDALSEEPAITIPEHPNGPYTLYIRSIGDGGLEGADRKLAFEVAQTVSPPTLIEPQADAVRQEPRPSFRWQVDAGLVKTSLEVSRDSQFQSLAARTPFASQQATRPDRTLAAGDYFWRVVTLMGENDFGYSETRRLRIVEPLQETQVIATNYGNGVARIFWDQVPHARSYLLQVAEDEVFTRIKSETTVSGNNASLTLDAGVTWYVRLKPMADEWYTARFGPPHIVRLP